MLGIRCIYFLGTPQHYLWSILLPKGACVKVAYSWPSINQITRPLDVGMSWICRIVYDLLAGRSRRRRLNPLLTNH